MHTGMFPVRSEALLVRIFRVMFCIVIGRPINGFAVILEVLPARAWCDGGGRLLLCWIELRWQFYGNRQTPVLCANISAH